MRIHITSGLTLFTLTNAAIWSFPMTYNLEMPLTQHFQKTKYKRCNFKVHYSLYPLEILYLKAKKIENSRNVMKNVQE